jgi:biopolymer transport protein ExbD
MRGPILKASARTSHILKLRNFGVIAVPIMLTAALAIGLVLQKRRMAGPIVNLPVYKSQFSTKPSHEHATVITATLTSTLEDKIYLNTTLTRLEELPNQLNLLRRTNPALPIYLKIDRRLPWGKAIRIWQFVRTERWELVSLVVSGRDPSDERIVKVRFGLPPNDHFLYQFLNMP